MSIYTTNYENYSQSQLTALFSSETWKTLSFSQRISACQEIENRYAVENNVHPCIITYQPMDGACYGWQSGNTICLNSYLLQDGQFCTNFKDSTGNTQSIRTNVLAPGWNTLDTVYHEGTHGIQEQAGRMPSTYISPEMDDDLYRIQGIEKEAYASGQTKTLEAISDYETNVGHLDPERNEYIASVKADSFQAALIDASHNYNDPNIELTLQTVINDRESGFSPANTSESYEVINKLCDSYDIHSSMDVSSVANASPVHSPLDIQQSEYKNPGAEIQLNDNFLHTDFKCNMDNQLDDGLSDTNAAEISIKQAESISYEDGSEGFTTSNYSSEVFTDDGLNNFVSDNMVTEQDDGFTYSNVISDYGSSEQSYTTDGLDDCIDADFGFSSEDGISASNRLAYSK